MRWLTLLLVLIGAVPTAAETLRLEVDGYARQVIVAAPPGPGPFPTILLFHGAGGTAAGMLADNHWAVAGPRAGYLVAALEALPVDPARPGHPRTNPNVWASTGSAPRAPRRNDDFVYVDRTLAVLGERWALAPGRLYAAGHSNGSTFAQTLLLRRPGLVQAVMVMAGWAAEERLAPPGASILILGGDLDPLAPLHGGTARTPWGPTERPAQRDTPERWAAALSCREQPAEATPAIVWRSWQGCRGGAVIRFGVLQQHGHGWPGGTTRLPQSILGPARQDIDATQLALRFFTDAAR